MIRRVKKEENSALCQPKVLIVDDERALCNLFKKALTKEGYNVLVAENGDEAINVVKKDEPDLVLLDIRMPGIGGIDVLRHLKAIKRNLAVVVLTGYGTIESARMAMMLGAHDYITKPFNIGYLKAIIKDALRNTVKETDTKIDLKKKTTNLEKLREIHCRGTTPCMWEVAVRTFGFGEDKYALGWMEDPKVPNQDKTALIELSHALASRMKGITKRT